MASHEAYCVKDKKMVTIQHPAAVVFKNGRHALAGTCPLCGNKVFRTVPSS